MATQRENESFGVGPEYRIVALVAALTVPLTLFSQRLSFFVSTLEALSFQPEGLANPSAEGWWPQRCAAQRWMSNSMREGGAVAALTKRIPEERGVFT